MEKGSKVSILATVVDAKELRGTIMYYLQIEGRTNPIWVSEDQIKSVKEY